MQRILYLQYANPAAYPPLDHSSRILAQENWHVMFLGIKQAENDILVFPPHKGITIKLLSSCPPGWRQKLHYGWFSLYAIVLALYWMPKWIYASDSLSNPPAWVLSLLPWVKVVYHEHDTPTNVDGSVFMRLVFAARRSLARRAKICVLPNPERAARFSRELSNGHTVCVWNCPSQEEIHSEGRVPNGDTLWLLYHGSIVPARLPISVLQALSLLPLNVKLRIVGYETLGHRGYVHELQETACVLGLAERVEFVGSVPTRGELFDWCRRSNVGLAFMPTSSADINMVNMTGASNKPFDYLACGMALLVSNLPDWRELFVDGGYGLACDVNDPASIASAIHWFLDHPREMQLMGERGRWRINEEWNYEKQFARVLERLNAG
jgi:glycosyltransferase involved in cell wall biosynthesis